MSPIPWAAILTHGPTLVSAARSLLANQSSKINERHQSIETRLDHLEKASVETARLIQEMAEQQQALSLAQQDVRRRLRLVLIVASVAAALSIGVAMFTIAN